MEILTDSASFSLISGHRDPREYQGRARCTLHGSPIRVLRQQVLVTEPEMRTAFNKARPARLRNDASEEDL